MRRLTWVIALRRFDLVRNAVRLSKYRQPANSSRSRVSDSGLGHHAQNSDTACTCSTCCFVKIFRAGYVLEISTTGRFLEKTWHKTWPKSSEPFSDVSDTLLAGLRLRWSRILLCKNSQLVAFSHGNTMTGWLGFHWLYVQLKGNGYTIFSTVFCKGYNLFWLHVFVPVKWATSKKGSTLNFKSE